MIKLLDILNEITIKPGQYWEKFKVGDKVELIYDDGVKEGIILEIRFSGDEGEGYVNKLDDDHDIVEFVILVNKYKRYISCYTNPISTLQKIKNDTFERKIKKLSSLNEIQIKPELKLVQGKYYFIQVNDYTKVIAQFKGWNSFKEAVFIEKDKPLNAWELEPEDIERYVTYYKPKIDEIQIKPDYHKEWFRIKDKVMLDYGINPDEADDENEDYYRLEDLINRKTDRLFKLRFGIDYDNIE